MLVKNSIVNFGISRDILSNKSVEAVLPLIRAMVEREGHCVQRHRVDRVYGAEVVELAIVRGLVNRHRVIVRDKTNRVPDQSVESVVTELWDLSKPLWLE